MLLSESETVEMLCSLNQIITVYNVTLFVFQWAIDTSSWKIQEKFSEKSIWAILVLENSEVPKTLPELYVSFCLLLMKLWKRNCVNLVSSMFKSLWTFPFFCTFSVRPSFSFLYHCYHVELFWRMASSTSSMKTDLNLFFLKAQFELMHFVDFTNTGCNKLLAI